jgi:signal recognition particle receptor subunit beta
MVRLGNIPKFLIVCNKSDLNVDESNENIKE